MPYNLEYNKTDSYGKRPNASNVLVLFILLFVVLCTFSQHSVAPEEYPIIGTSSEGFGIKNNTNFEFFLYRLAGNVPDKPPTNLTLPPNGGSTTVYVQSTAGEFRYVEAEFWVYDPRGGIDPEQAGQVKLRMIVSRRSGRSAYRDIDQVQINRAPTIDYNIGFWRTDITFVNR
ncbi:hypothetical protein M3223_19705 [Paenibacillus pasadenensis]|uniref:hypothetical protein n=1 Tax=Paenibacillus pasadenensis TaxID=217090 RepID=UPI00203F301A|nr:hypothetical protein [Paenibacillus pasadenensis]MCM3749581.1 hypothetical protein [Paenibacillus pasadenensis]